MNIIILFILNQFNTTNIHQLTWNSFFGLDIIKTASALKIIIIITTTFILINFLLIKF